MRLLTKAHPTSISHSLSLKEGSVMLFRMLTQAYLAFGTIVAQLESIYSGDRVRTYWVHKPDNFDIAKKYPVVVALHGGSRISENLDGVAMGADTRLSQRVRGIKFSSDRYFIYPNGVGGVWAGPSYAHVPISTDLQFISDMLDHLLTNNKNIDASRIYLAGLSNGGELTNLIACDHTLSARFAAFAAVAGSFYTDHGKNNCRPARHPLPMLEIHGGADKNVPYNGGIGRGGKLPPIPTWLDWWAHRNVCTFNSTVNSDGGNVHHTTWICDGKNGALQHWKVDKNGHDWPSKELSINMILARVGPQPIEANDIVIDFFDQWKLPSSYQ